MHAFADLLAVHVVNANHVVFANDGVTAAVLVFTLGFLTADVHCFD